MNNFTQPQLETIVKLAEGYFDKVLPPIPGGASVEARYSTRERYVDAIVAGLTDPDLWGE